MSEQAGWRFRESLARDRRLAAAEAELAATTSAWAAAADERDQRNSELAAIRAYLGVPEKKTVMEFFKRRSEAIDREEDAIRGAVQKYAQAREFERRLAGSAAGWEETRAAMEARDAADRRVIELGLSLPKPADGGTK